MEQPLPAISRARRQRRRGRRRLHSFMLLKLSAVSQWNGQSYEKENENFPFAVFFSADAGNRGKQTEAGSGLAPDGFS